MLKVIVDGNSKDGWDISTEIPPYLDGASNDGGILILFVEPDSFNQWFTRFDNELMNKFGCSLLEQEFAVVHEDSALDAKKHVIKEYKQPIEEDNDPSKPWNWNKGDEESARKDDTSGVGAPPNSDNDQFVTSSIPGYNPCK